MIDALFAVRHETQLRELGRAAGLLSGTGRFRPTLLFHDTSPGPLSRMLAECAREGWPTRQFIPTEATSPGRGVPTDRGGGVRRALRSAKRALPAALGETLAAPWYFWSRRREMRASLALAAAHLRELRPALLVVPEDGVGGHRALIASARRQGVAVLIIPYEFSTLRQPLESLRESPTHCATHGLSNLANRLVAWTRPRWKLEQDGLCLLRQPGAHVLADERLGLGLDVPWAVHGGQADRLAAESPRMVRHYRSLGLAASKIVLTGALYDDVLWYRSRRVREERPRLLREAGLSPERLLVLCALPPDQLVTRPSRDFATYQHLLRFWVERVQAVPDAAVLFQPHPRLTPEQIAFVESLGARVLRGDIAELIPLCDLLVTSVSSIIRMAIALGKPVLNYDVFRFGYDDYADAGGVLTFAEKEQFSALLGRVAEERFLSELAAKQRAGAHDWGMLDGRCGERVLALVDELCAAVSRRADLASVAGPR